jgi:predicted secreted protein
MRLPLLVLSLVVSSSAVAMGCASSAPEEEAIDDGSTDAEEADLIKKSILLDKGDDGSKVTVQRGQKVTIKLAQNRTTGFSWSVKSDGGLGNPTRRDVAGSAQQVGSGGHVLLSWDTTRDTLGTHAIELELRRSFENGPPAERFRVTLDLKAPGPVAGKCGGLAGLRCTGSEFCDFGSSACGKFDQMGTCATRPQKCALVFSPVCGCNGQTFSNACKARAAGVDVAANGACTF